MLSLVHISVFGSSKNLLSVGGEPKFHKESDFALLLDKLSVHACRWRDIGLHLRFLPSELDNIQARPFLQPTAPESWLGAMLTEWLQRALDNMRGISSIESLTHTLLAKVD